ncbi:two-component sensory histidine kinase (drug sensor/ATP binding) [Desulforapulum autotrophicum HRM2]|uniref:histidine kinase n=1 Tax=Desulforapulum autotrophicum (strain ATCC 43914 / DSM 3382 / VKM B-1955 / HRM2) TaxID=177437 RepID=C0QEH7_DESAH|nr:ATP-binding protein [Desulforapulum autotrophicum]ACN15319.1 two-component sensory histidine kinase (drug sensor/ATP binding) [Desulforapulum autotrophicum HRM2]
MADISLSIRTKLIVIFVFIKVLPLVVLAWFSWNVISELADTLGNQTAKMTEETNKLVGGIAEMATSNSINALNDHSREAIERLTTDTARQVADFLYGRDTDIRLAAGVEPDKETYQRFLSHRTRGVLMDDGNWKMDADKKKWVPADSKTQNALQVSARNDENRKNFHYRLPEPEARVEEHPLYLEMTYVDLAGMEQFKVTTLDLLPDRLLDVSKKENTFCKAETYFASLNKLKPGEIYVSEVIGAYVKGYLIGGAYSEDRAEKAGIPFKPETSGYAGKENPLGIRFRGLIRWATPVIGDGGQIKGYVTLALDHTHIMEFTDHILPTEARYCVTSDAGSGNYAFMWDYKGRNISHARDYFIVGYDPETGKPAVPWLEASLYPKWLESNGSMEEFEKAVPWFDEQSLKKKPSSELTRQGFVGLDGRFLNFAPQCTGWHTLTEHGGSGSFVIFWSHLWKLTTAAAIPYHTGIYGKHPRGFGFVTIGANVDEFHKPAMETAEKILSVRKNFEKNLHEQEAHNHALIQTSLNDTSIKMTVYTLVMVMLVILIALWMAAVLTRKITQMIRGIRIFQKGDRTFRLQQSANDEIGQLASSFNQMADNIQQYIEEVESAKATTEKANALLEVEVGERRTAQEALSRNRDHLEEMVKERTSELEKEIRERKRAEKELVHSEKMVALGQLIAGIAHEINTPMGAIKSSGCNISDAMKKVLVDLPVLLGRLDQKSLLLFHELLEKSQEEYPLLTSREERKLIRAVSGNLAGAGVDNSRHMAFFIVQLNAHEQWGRFLPLFQHEESVFIFETAYGLHTITSNTHNINQAVDRISKIIYALKSYIRKSDSKKKTATDVVEGIETVLTIYHNQIKLNTELIREYESVPLIMGYPDELNQVWTNLVHNALQAMNYKGVLKINVKNINDQIVVSITDTGCGIPADHRGKIFKPFFTTKERGEGSGLGLDIINKIIKNHGGRIDWESEVGKGTTFTVSLPQSEDA